MKRIAVFFAISFVVHPGFAAARKHHPWFSHGSSAHAKTRRSVSVARVYEFPVPAAEPADSPSESLLVHKAPETTTEAGHKVVQQAMRYQGTRYKFGGTNQHGLDCSGLVSRVWSDLKMQRIPRVSSALYRSGQPVGLAELRPGDLVFFKNTYKHGISHVGVYTGNNKFVHAANHKMGVTVASLSDPYYQLHYAGARRLY